MFRVLFLNARSLGFFSFFGKSMGKVLNCLSEHIEVGMNLIFEVFVECFGGFVGRSTLIGLVI